MLQAVAGFHISPLKALKPSIPNPKPQTLLEEAETESVSSRTLSPKCATPTTPQHNRGLNNSKRVFGYMVLQLYEEEKSHETIVGYQKEPQQ